MLRSGISFSPFEVGQIKAHMHHELGATQIAGIVTKPDGISHWSHTAVQDQMDALTNDPTYTGARQPGSGAKRKTTKKQDRQILSCVTSRGEKCAPFGPRHFGKVLFRVRQCAPQAKNNGGREGHKQCGRGYSRAAHNFLHAQDQEPR